MSEASEAHSLKDPAGKDAAKKSQTSTEHALSTGRSLANPYYHGKDSPFYAPERGGTHPAPRVSGQAYVTDEMREKRRREVEAEGAAAGALGIGAGSFGGVHHKELGAKDTTTSAPPPHSASKSGGYLEQELYEKNIIDSAYAAGVKSVANQKGIGHEGSSKTKGEPVVEVIGVSDRDKAQKIALKATNELARQGRDVLLGKIVVDANKREIYIEENAEDAEKTREAEKHQKLAERTSGGGIAGAAVGAAAGTAAAGTAAGTAAAVAPDAAYGQKNPREVDPRQFHSQHQEVKRELEQDAKEGRLGDVGGVASFGSL